MTAAKSVTAKLLTCDHSLLCDVAWRNTINGPHLGSERSAAIILYPMLCLDK